MPRARLRQDKLPRAHIECAPTDYVSDKGRKLRAGHRPLLAPSGGVSARRRWEREPCGGQECFGPRLAKTLVGASIARLCPLALQDNCPGKCVAAVSWRATNGRPYTRNREERASSLPATKNVGADSISARARLRQDKPPRAHIECAPTDFVFDIGLAGSGRYNKKRVRDILDVTDSWCAVQDSNL